MSDRETIDTEIAAKSAEELGVVGRPRARAESNEIRVTPALVLQYLEHRNAGLQVVQAAQATVKSGTKLSLSSRQARMIEMAAAARQLELAEEG